MLKGNKGEWSEIYVLLRLLADGKIYSADENLNKLENIYFPILKIIREEIKGEVKEYEIDKDVKIYINGEKIKEIPTLRFEEEAINLLNEIRNEKSKSSFSIEKSEEFINQIKCFKLSAPSSNKSDIIMKIIDINTGFSPTVGFSIKSELGASPTLLNAGKTTNFIYEIQHENNILKEVNSIYKISGEKKHIDVRGRIAKLIKDNALISYYGMENETFKDNLVLIDSNMDRIISETILYFYRDGITNCVDMVNKLELENPENYRNKHAYAYKFKKFLTSVALGLKPATLWNGTDEANGGYIIVNKEGGVVDFHIYNRNYFEDYLLKNTRYETASTTKHDFGKLYDKNNFSAFNSLESNK